MSHPLRVKVRSIAYDPAEEDRTFLGLVWSLTTAKGAVKLALGISVIVLVTVHLV